MNSPTLQLTSSKMCFGGLQNRYSHVSEVNQCTMHFSIFLPREACEESPLPVVYWLSGLTCTDENFVLKAGAQRYAAELGLIIVCPDTSPRGEGIPDDDNESWDFGLGAGFYVNATQTPWAKHYNMYDYVVHELPDIIDNHFATTPKTAITGHSMGGHGALMCALKNQNRFSSVSAFSPIANPLQCAWGKKAFNHYLGDDTSTWQEYDSCELIKQHGIHLPVLIDQGLDDEFLEAQLKTENLINSSAQNNNLSVRFQENYDHSYFFIASFIGEHLAFHKKHLEELGAP